MKKLLLGAILISVMLLAGRPAAGLINPKFTPVHLVKQSSLVATVQVTAIKGEKKNVTVELKLLKPLQGKTDLTNLTLDLSTCAVDEQRDSLVKKLKAVGDMPLLLFVGEFESAGAGAGTPQDAKVYLHVLDEWQFFFPGKANGTYVYDGMDSTNMPGTFQGSTDMLIRAVNYIINDQDAVLPVAEQISMANEPVKFGKIDGAVSSMHPIDLAGDGKQLCMYITAEKGDKVFQWDSAAKKLADLTAKFGLEAKSKLVAFGDFNADGKLDIVSWDGAAVTLYTQSAEGKFSAGAKLAKDDLKDDVIALSTCDSGKDNKPLVVIAAGNKVMTWLPGDKPAALEADAALTKDLDKAKLCVVADFDGDGLPDVLQVFTKGSLVYKGKAPGQFEAPKACKLAAGIGKVSPCLGDFDGDGLPDLFIPGDEASTFWQNNGKFDFTERLVQTGEFAYKSNNGLIGCTACDFNNDGRQDLALFYTAGEPHMFFSRGFRSFGHCNTINIGPAVPGCDTGQQAGCMADIMGTGGQQMFMVLKSGECYMLPREETGLAAKVYLSSKAAAGPITVNAFMAGRQLGSWVIRPGDEAFFGASDKGVITVKWTLPGGKPQQKDIPLETKPKSFVIGQ